MRTGLLTMVMVIAVTQLPGAARSQSGTDVSPAIQVHPDVPTILQLPDEIEAVWSIGGGEVMVKGVGSKVYLRPRPDTPAGVEVFIEVKTRTMHRMFLVRVVERAEDAAREVRVPEAAAPAPAVTAPAHEVTREARPAAPAPTASAPPSASSDADHPSVPERAEPLTEHAATDVRSPGFELSLHAVVALGFTGLDARGYEPDVALRSHRVLGARLTGAPRGAWWALEANVSGEWLAAPTVHGRETSTMRGREVLEVSGPWLRVDAGVRAKLGTRWMPTAYAGIAMQAHLGSIEKALLIGQNKQPLSSIRDMKYGAVLALGMGLQYRAGDALLGVEFQMRQGVPADYRSVAALWSIGCFLDQGE